MYLVVNNVLHPLYHSIVRRRKGLHLERKVLSVTEMDRGSMKALKALVRHLQCCTGACEPQTKTP